MRDTYRTLERAVHIEEIALEVLRKNELRGLVVACALVAIGEEDVDDVLHEVLPHFLHTGHDHAREEVPNVIRHDRVSVAVFEQCR